MARTEGSSITRTATNRRTGPLGLTREAAFIGWQEGPCASVEELIESIGPQHLCVLRSQALGRPLGAPPKGHQSGKTLPLFYGTSVARAGGIAAGDAGSMGVGRQGYFGPGIYLAGDAYTAMRVAESANNREGCYGANAFEEPPVPLHLFRVEVEVGRVCQVREQIRSIRQWAFDRFGLSESDDVLKYLGEYLLDHGYDTAVIADEAGPGQDYWLIGERWRITLTDEVVLLPKQNWIGRRTHPVNGSERIAQLLERTPIDAGNYQPITLSEGELQQIQEWRQQLVESKDPSKLEKQFKGALFDLLGARLPTHRAEFAKQFLAVEALHVPVAQHGGADPERLMGLYDRLRARGEWEAEVVPRVAEVVLFKPEKYADLSQAMYWAIRQFTRRNGWA